MVHADEVEETDSRSVLDWVVLRKNENHVGNVFHGQSFLASAHELSLDMLRLPSLSVRGFLKSYHAGIARCLGAAFRG